MIAARFLKKVELTINKFKLLSNGQKVVVAVSGGPDSAALLHVLWRLKEKYQLSIWAAHLNHLIRGEEAEEDERWVREFTASLKVPLICERIDVSLIAREKKGGIEQVAREVRYRFLEEVARRVSADKIAVGHTASDQAETFLMRVIRGSGTDGLAGISPVRGKIIRPLIRMFRWEVESYCQQENILPRRDSTNLDRRFLRNRIRFELIPYLARGFNLRIVETLARNAEILQTEKQFLEEEAKKAFRKVLKGESEKEIVIDSLIFFQLHLALQRKVIRLAIQRLKGDLKKLRYSHIESILHLKEKEGTKKINLPGKLFCLREYDELVLKKEEKKTTSFFSYLNVPGRTEVPEAGMVVETEILSESPLSFPNDPYEAFLDFDKIPGKLYLRPRKKGDRFIPLGMKGEKKLKDFFIDLKVPRFKREKVALLVSEEKIVWVVGYRIDERFKLDKKSKRILKVKVRLNEA